jgi:hypothetical protein
MLRAAGALPERRLAARRLRSASSRNVSAILSLLTISARSIRTSASVAGAVAAHATRRTATAVAADDVGDEIAEAVTRRVAGLEAVRWFISAATV